MEIIDGIIIKVNGDKTDINFRGYTCTADGVVSLSQSETWVKENVIESQEYLKHYCDEYFGGDNVFLGDLKDGTFEFANGIMVHKEWNPEINEDGNPLIPVKCFTLPSGYVAVKVI